MKKFFLKGSGFMNESLGLGEELRVKAGEKGEDHEVVKPLASMSAITTPRSSSTRIL